MLMNTPVHCLEGLLVSRVDEQQMHWLTEWISNMSLFFGGALVQNTRRTLPASVVYVSGQIRCLCFNLRLQQLKILLLHW